MPTFTKFEFAPNEELKKLRQGRTLAEEKARKASFKLARILGYSHPSELRPGFKPYPE